MRAMSKETKDAAGTWLYRALAIYFLWNIYTDVSSIDVIKSKVEKHDQEIAKLQEAVFTHAWIRRSTPEEKRKHQKETKFLEEYTGENIHAAKDQLSEVDSLNRN